MSLAAQMPHLRERLFFFLAAPYFYINSHISPTMFSLLPLLFLTLLVVSSVSVSFPSTADILVTRDVSSLYLGSSPWTASGANVYWLGLDENIRPSSLNSPPTISYPTKARITEIFDTMVAIGARTVRSQTLGVSVGHPLSVMPRLGEVNEEAFENMDWAIREARRTGVRVFAPLVSVGVERIWRGWG